MSSPYSWKRCWLSPFYLNLLLTSALDAARDRELETGANDHQLGGADIDDGYDRLLANRSRFIHWYQRLERDLAAPERGFALDCLAAIAKSKQGLTRRQLLNRLQKREADSDQRAQRLDRVLLKLEEDGYLAYQTRAQAADQAADQAPDQVDRLGFPSFLLRDYWRRNHA